MWGHWRADVLTRPGYGTLFWQGRVEGRSFGRVMSLDFVTAVFVIGALFWQTRYRALLRNGALSVEQDHVTGLFHIDRIRSRDYYSRVRSRDETSGTDHE